MTADDREVFKLAVMPMLSFGDARLRDVNAHLTTFERVNQFGERTSWVVIHLVVIDCFLLGKITQIGCHEFVAEGPLRQFNHVDAILVGCCICTLMDDVNDFAKGGFMGDGTVAVSPS